MVDTSVFTALRFRTQPKGLDTNKLSEMLEKAYLNRRKETKFITKETFAPSGIGYGKSTCARYWYHAFTGAEFDEASTAADIASMNAGEQAGKRLADLLDEAGLLVDREIEIAMDDPPIRGYMDVVINWEGNEIPGEIKTTRQEMFVFRQNTQKPTLYNMYQILIYMKATKKDIGFLLYENKNNQNFLIIPVEWTPKTEKLLEDAFEWLRWVRRSWEEGQVPNRGFPTKRNKACRNCPVRKTCWSDDAPEPTVTIPLMPTPKL